MPRGRPRKNTGGVLIRSAELIGWAIGGLEREIVETRHRLTALTAEAERLRKQVGRSAGKAFAAGATGTSHARRAPRKMSPEARKRIGDAAKRRWAKWRAAKRGKQ
jgi:hypothetical protein